MSHSNIDNQQVGYKLISYVYLTKIGKSIISDNSDNPKNRLQDREFIKQEEFQISGPVVFPTVQYGYA